MPKDDYFSSKPTSSRPLKVGEEIRRAMSEIFMRGESHIYDIDHASITVSEVRVGPDLKNATVFIMPLAGGNKETLLNLLKEHAPHFRHLLAGKVILRHVPKIYFKLDESYEEAHRINELLKKPEVARDLRADEE